MRYRPTATPLADILSPPQPRQQQRQRHQPPEPGARPYIPLTTPPPLLAENARTLAMHAGPCARCSHAMLSGERVGDLPAGGGTIHLSCLSGQA